MERKATLGNCKLEKLGEFCKLLVFLVEDTSLEYNDTHTHYLMRTINDVTSELLKD